MLILISPAKSLNFDKQTITTEYTLPQFEKEAKQLVNVLKKQKAQDLSKLMGISDKLAHLNYERFAVWQKEHTEENSKQAVLSFTGDVYQGLQAHTFEARDFEFAQQHLRILSGLYGLLQPLDLIQPYRLEMGTKLVFKDYKNLYNFWDTKINKAINTILKEEKTLINLASNEYFKSVQSKNIKGDIITPIFKEQRGDDFKIISFSAKKARGLMTAFIIKNQIENPEDIKAFSEENYNFHEGLSKEKEWVFVR